MRKVGDTIVVHGRTYKAVATDTPGFCYGCECGINSMDEASGDYARACPGCYGSATVLRHVEEKETTMPETDPKPAPAPAWELRVKTPCTAGVIVAILSKYCGGSVTVEGDTIVVRP